MIRRRFGCPRSVVELGHGDEHFESRGWRRGDPQDGGRGKTVEPIVPGRHEAHEGAIVRVLR